MSATAKSAVESLCERERTTLRLWGAHVFSDGEPISFHGDSTRYGAHFGLALNAALRGLHADPHARFMSFDLDARTRANRHAGRLIKRPRVDARDYAAALAAGLSRLPRVDATLLHIAYISANAANGFCPYGHSIRLGDIVSSGPEFLSASSAIAMALDSLSGRRAARGTGADVLLIADIRARTARPIFYPALSNDIWSREWLFAPDTRFRVIGFAATNVESTSANNVVAVVLEELDPVADLAAGDEPPTADVKNMFTGKELKPLLCLDSLNAVLADPGFGDDPLHARQLAALLANERVETSAAVARRSASPRVRFVEADDECHDASLR